MFSEKDFERLQFLNKIESKPQRSFHQLILHWQQYFLHRMPAVDTRSGGTLKLEVYNKPYIIKNG